MAGSREGERLMLFSVEYQCGCKEDAVGNSLPRKCPMHGDPAVRSFVASREATSLMYGKNSWRSAFYPAYRGCKDLGMSEILTVELLEELVKKARSSEPVMRPAVSDDGREFYFMAGPTREGMIQAIEAGWSYRCVSFDGGRFFLQEPFRIDYDGPKKASGAGYYESGYIP